ncbi:MAG: hypothetical protein Crog4KO_12200 [Crocinitomicaceae bacterium]
MEIAQLTIILDLDGVLITTPPWKPDQMDSDGYSLFNKSCVENLNKLLDHVDAELWLSSTRRTVKTLSEFNQIFKHRGINGSIKGFLPEYENCFSRKEEVLKFIEEHKCKNYLIIDDDKSLDDLDDSIKQRLIRTELLNGFRDVELQRALNIIESWT